MTAPVHNSAIMLPRKICQYSASGWADGCAGAPAGRPQRPNLLDGYGPNRPPWNVAGVDYRVGVPDGMVLTDWQTLPQSGSPVAIDPSTGIIWMSGDYVFDGFDFTTGVGGTIYNRAGEANNITVLNSKFSTPGNPRPNNPFILDQNGATIIVRYCHFDGITLAATAPIGTRGSLTFEYNELINFGSRIVECSSSVPNCAIVYRYNFIDDMTTIGCSSHTNYFESDIGTTTNIAVLIAFNTTFQKSLLGAEAFQVYPNTSGSPTVTYPSPAILNNTLIARPATPATLCGSPRGPQTMSYLIHGGGSLTGVAQVRNNYFDISGAYAAFYPTTMAGWMSSGNIDMNTGAIITPT